VEQGAAVWRIHVGAEVSSAARVVDHVMQGVRHRVDGVDDEWNDSFLFVLRRRDPLVSCPAATQTLLDPTTVYIGACRNWRI